MTEPARATARGLELIRVLGERGLSHAAEALSGMLGCRVCLRLTDVFGPPASAMPPWTEDVEGRSAVLLRVLVRGEGRGRILILLPIPAFARILQELLGRTTEPHNLAEIDRSAAQEFGNVLASSFLSELGDRLGRRLLPSPPELHVDDVAAPVRDVLAWVHALDAGVWVIQACLAAPERGLEGEVFIVLDDGALASVTGGAARGRGVCT